MNVIYAHDCNRIAETWNTRIETFIWHFHKRSQFTSTQKWFRLGSGWISIASWSHQTWANTCFQSSRILLLNKSIILKRFKSWLIDVIIYNFLFPIRSRYKKEKYSYHSDNVYEQYALSCLDVDAVALNFWFSRFSFIRRFWNLENENINSSIGK